MCSQMVNTARFKIHIPLVAMKCFMDVWFLQVCTQSALESYSTET